MMGMVSPNSARALVRAMAAQGLLSVKVVRPPARPLRPSLLARKPAREAPSSPPQPQRFYFPVLGAMDGGDVMVRMPALG